MRGTPATEGGQTGRAHPHSLVLSHSISISRSHSAEPRPNCQVKVTVACEWNFKSLLASGYTMRDPTKGVLGLWCNLWTCWVSMVVHLLNLTCQTLHRLILFLHCVERSEWGRRLDRSVWAGEKKKREFWVGRILCAGFLFSSDSRTSTFTKQRFSRDKWEAARLRRSAVTDK